MIVYKKGVSLYRKDGEKLSIDDFTHNLVSSGSDKIFVKPISGCGEASIQVLSRIDNGYKLDGSLFRKNDTFKLPGDYVIESMIVQSEYLNDVYPHSVNTLRAVTLRLDDGSIQIVAVTLRMGTEGRQVDNSSQGGLLIGIDLNTGFSYRQYAGCEYGSEKIFSHPDTGFEFKNLKNHNCSEVKDAIFEFAQKMALYNLGGWDIALTDLCHVVIAANTKFGIDHSQSGVGEAIERFLVDREYYSSASNAAKEKYESKYTISVFEEYILSIFREVQS